jgi:hypothetical protein
MDKIDLLKVIENFEKNSINHDQNAQFKETKVREFANGAIQISIDGKIDRITYNTGDTCWFKLENGKYTVCAYYTWDNLQWGDIPDCSIII